MSEVPAGEFLLYETEDGKTSVECRFVEETLWLTQALMADLFQVTVPTINEHLKTSRSHKQAVVHAEAEYERFAAQRRALLEAEGEAHNVEMLEAAAKALPKPEAKNRKQGHE